MPRKIPVRPVSDPYLNIAAGVIAQAEMDWHDGGTARRRSELLEFLDSPWFDTLCANINQDVGRTRTAVVEGWGRRYARNV